MVCRIWPGNQFSNGAKLLAEALHIHRIKNRAERFIGQAGDTVINWGGTALPLAVQHGCSFVLNEPCFVKVCSNKRVFFEKLAEFDVRTVPWFTESYNVQKHLDDGKIVVARTILNGHSGSGIKIIHKSLDIVDAPLYTVYVPKKLEYRIHVVNKTVVDIQRKIKRPDYDADVDWHVRNHAGGFIYVRNGVRDNVPEDCIKQALAAVEHTGINFGAVDVIFNEKEGQAYVLEINTAPGLEGLTVQLYAAAIDEHFNADLKLHL